jgi:hypothetical protein
MATIRGIILAQWADVKGNVKFAALCLLISWGGSATLIAWFTGYIQRLRGAPEQDRLGYVILAVLCFCGLVLSGMFLYIVMPRDRSQRFTQLPAPSRKDQASLGVQKQTSPQTAPLPVDLQGDVKGGVKPGH